MGAYEYQGTPPCLADFTGDGVLDFFDVSLFLQAFGAGCPGTSANAQLFQMDFTIAYDSYEFDFGDELPTDLTVTGTVIWDANVSAFSDNGVNSHYWEYLSFEAVGVGILDDGTDVGFTINRGPTAGNANYVIQSVHSPSQNASNMYWRGSLDATPAGFDFGSFNISTLGVTAMPAFESPLPSTISGYESGGAFRDSFTLFDDDFNSYDFNASSMSVVITEFDCIADINGDGVIDFFDISGFIQAFAAGCP